MVWLKEPKPVPFCDVLFAIVGLGERLQQNPLCVTLLPPSANTLPDTKPEEEDKVEAAPVDTCGNKETLGMM